MYCITKNNIGKMVVFSENMCVPKFLSYAREANLVRRSYVNLAIIQTATIIVKINQTFTKCTFPFDEKSGFWVPGRIESASQTNIELEAHLFKYQSPSVPFITTHLPLVPF